MQYNIEIKDVHEGEDYVAMTVNGLEIEMQKVEGKAVLMLIKTIKFLTRAR